jgi:hypothetical protein
MRIVSNIDTKPRLLENDLSPEILEKLPTFRQLLKVLISTSTEKNAEAAQDLFNAGIKLVDAKEFVELEDSQWRHLHNKARENGPGWYVPFHAQVITLLEKAEKK